MYIYIYIYIYKLLISIEIILFFTFSYEIHNIQSFCIVLIWFLMFSLKLILNHRNPIPITKSYDFLFRIDAHARSSAILPDPLDMAVVILSWSCRDPVVVLFLLSWSCRDPVVILSWCEFCFGIAPLSTQPAILCEFSLISCKSIENSQQINGNHIFSMKINEKLTFQ